MECSMTCPRCSEQYPLFPFQYLCRSCLVPMSVQYHYTEEDSLRGALLKTSSEKGIWRYQSFLPLNQRPTLYADIFHTPLLATEIYGCTVYLKDETRNPSLSLKDRASYIVTAFAEEHDIKDIVCASTGNAGVALARMCAGRSVKAHIIVPSQISESKLALLRAFGATVHRIQGSYDDAYELSIELSRCHGFFNRNTAYNPLCREGKKTVSFEICEQLDWTAPDWVVVPIGDGNIVSGVWKGFKEFYAAGLIDKLPRILGVQAFGSNAIAQSLSLFKANSFESTIVKVKTTTTAQSISVALPRDGHFGCASIIESGGTVIELTDSALWHGVTELAAKYGIVGETSSAAAFQGMMQACATHIIERGASVVCIITGHGIKEHQELLQFCPLTESPPMKPAEFHQRLALQLTQ